jgi:hypothetical protein
MLTRPPVRRRRRRCLLPHPGRLLGELFTSCLIRTILFTRGAQNRFVDLDGAFAVKPRRGIWAGLRRILIGRR